MDREALETYIVPMVIENLTPAKHAAIEEAMDEHIRGLSAPQHRRKLMIIDTNYHLKIIECAGNKVIYNTSRLIFEQIYLKYRPEYMRDSRLVVAAEEHRRLFEALKEKEGEKTRRLIKQHIKSGRDHIVGSLLEDRHIEF
jgi:DNA-binding GntR family transcriptional regulator